MKTSTATIMLLAAAGSAIADACHQGGVYCGQSLLNRGDYTNHITQVLLQNAQPTDTNHIDNSLFACGSGGDITFISFCGNGCAGVGSTDDDFCR